MHVTRGGTGDDVNTAHYRHHLELESGAEATIIEHYLSTDEQRHFTGARLTMSVADNAHLQYIKLAFENAQSNHFAHNDLALGRDASVFSSSFLLGGAVLRHHTSTQLLGENSTLRINSLAMPVNNEVCDSRTWLDHRVGYCNSRQLHKTIVSDKGRAVFNGLINVAKHAIKTDGQMTNNNLLLGRRLKWTPGRSWKFMPTTSSVATVLPSGVSTTNSCSISVRVAFPIGRRSI
ncbi:hypothetical protein DMB90_06910 [Raoultella planticola]|uniref:SUF system FeS cluster assembly SufBD core domain-containing protein n=1 Tax=Raoultella planticola TaxID=575 RepID=A0A5P6A9G3_RAOPL|nr:hypothetical protein DMB90_06910 [Raoultella planticola]